MDEETNNIEKAEEYKQQGNKEVQKENYEKAIEFYSLAISLNGKNHAFYGNRALCFQKQKKYEQAIEDCNTAIRINPMFGKAFWRRGSCRAQLGQIQYAVNDYQSAQELDPKNKAIVQELENLKRLLTYFEAIEKLYSEKKYSETLNMVNQAIYLFSDNPDLIFLKIECLARSNQLDPAHKLIQQFQYTYQENPNFCYAQGIYMMYKALNDKAKQYFMKGCKLDPDNAKCKVALKQLKQIEALKLEGNNAFKSNQLEQAIEIYDKALQIDPENKQLNSLLHGNKSAAYIKMDKLDEALVESDKSIEFDDKNSKLYYRRADILEKLGDKAEENFKKIDYYDKVGYDLNKIKEVDPSQSHSANMKLNALKKKQQQAKKKDYYKILGVDRNATDYEIKKAYKKLAIKWHPDKNAETPEKKEEATAKFREIAEAYSILTDKNKRAIFDQGGDPENQQAGFGGGGFGGIDPNEIFSMFFGGGGAGSRGGGFSFGGGNDFFDGGSGGFGGFPGGNVRFTFK